jgi:4-hydroxybenzoate polyprenyltransferase
MSARLGKFVYWAATILAGLILVLAAVSYFANANMPIIRLPVLLLAVAIWLVGWACRYVFADREDQR